MRAERPADLLPIRRVNELAFGRPDEAQIVDALRARGALTLSLVAVDGDEIVAHALFSPVMIETGESGLEAVALGPIAVLPAWQNQGLGSKLCRAGLDRLKSKGHSLVVVLGHPGYYPRFGFRPATRFGLRSQWDVPDEVFMALELQPGALQGVQGLVRYQPEFDI